MAGFYSVFHGEKGLKGISTRIHTQAMLLAEALTSLGYEVLEKKNFFDTIAFKDEGNKVYNFMQDNEINIRKVNKTTSSISLDETVAHQDLRVLISFLAKAKGKDSASLMEKLETMERTSTVASTL